MTSPGRNDFSRDDLSRDDFSGMRCSVTDVLGHLLAWPLGRGSDQKGARRLEIERTQPVLPCDCPSRGELLGGNPLTWRTSCGQQLEDDCLLG